MKNYRKICVKIANARGYRNETTDMKVELVELNLHRWKEKAWKIKTDMQHNRFWQAVNKYERLMYGRCI